MKIETDATYEIPSPSADEVIALKKTIFPQIRNTLDKLGIPRGDYVIDGESATGQLCIAVDRSLWVVFTGERGERFNCAFFSGPWEAANYFLWELLRVHRDLFPDHPAIPFHV